ncbi:MAG: hypothetical protein J6W70_02690, partial [Lentisphaeria bacterium]|nr:hypothetical protein [Lentisphaeria bacterium]
TRRTRYGRVRCFSVLFFKKKSPRSGVVENLYSNNVARETLFFQFFSGKNAYSDCVFRFGKRKCPGPSLFPGAGAVVF